MNSVPLVDALSFLNKRDEDDSLRRIFIFDSIQTDARFLLHTLVLSRSNAEEQPVVWLSCSPTGTERNIKLASKRMGRSDKHFNVIHLAAGISKIILENEHNVEEMMEDYIKTLLRKVRQDEMRPAIILIDDISILAGLIGNDRAYALLQCLLSPAFQSSKIVCRGSLDWDQSVLLKSNNKGYWLDGLNNEYDTSNEYTWERGLVELADVVIDVLPLESGFSREAHGRIVITESMSQNREVINYCCNDHGVRAIQMRHGGK
mmetsp:Transcript_14732/g.21747  ORF Transcript_14732/g.21747 Transcript_14732/m.21747 type:complete len:261 (-) Transcript_14732:536-1318(-)